MKLEERMKKDPILRGSESKRAIISSEFDEFLNRIMDRGIDLQYFNANWNYSDGKYACFGGLGNPTK